MSEMASINRMHNVSAFHNLIVKHAEASVSLTLNKFVLYDIIDNIEAHALIISHMKEAPLNIDSIKEFWRDPFYTAFYIFIINLLKIPLEKPQLYNFSDPLEFIFDETSKKSKIVFGWEQFKAELDSRYRDLITGRINFEDDEKFFPLQAADFRAWWIREWAIERGIGNIKGAEFPFPITDTKIINISMSISDDDLKSFIYGNIDKAIREGSIKIFSPSGELLETDGDYIPVLRRKST